MRQISGSMKKGMIFSPKEEEVDHKTVLSRNCAQEGAAAGLKAASIAFVASSIPTLVGVRTIPWLKRNLNYTGQALVVSAASIATYFIVADQTILQCARTTSYDRMKAKREA